MLPNKRADIIFFFSHSLPVAKCQCGRQPQCAEHINENKYEQKQQESNMRINQIISHEKMTTRKRRRRRKKIVKSLMYTDIYLSRRTTLYYLRHKLFAKEEKKCVWKREREERKWRKNRKSPFPITNSDTVYIIWQKISISTFINECDTCPKRAVSWTNITTHSKKYRKRERERTS